MTIRIRKQKRKVPQVAETHLPSHSAETECRNDLESKVGSRDTREVLNCSSLVVAGGAESYKASGDKPLGPSGQRNKKSLCIWCLCISSLLICAIFTAQRPAGRAKKDGGYSPRPLGLLSTPRVVALKNGHGNTVDAQPLSGPSYTPTGASIELDENKDMSTKNDDVLEDDWEKRMKSRRMHDVHGDDCIFHPWQTTQYLNCNSIHEVVSSPGMLSFEAQGSQSIVFYFELPFESHPLALKAQRYEGGYESEFVEYSRRRRDAMVMGRLTSSPYVVSIYGFCAMSVVAPFASEGTLHNLVNSMRHGSAVPPMDRLRIGVQVSEGLAALHSIDATPSFAHNDLDISQHVYYDGIFRLNDFNYGKMLRHNPDGVPCMDTNHPVGAGRYHSPEIIESNEVSGDQVRLDVADVFSLGTELYMILTSKWVWEEDRGQAGWNKTWHRLVGGKRPPIPKKIARSTDGAFNALSKAIEMCWEHDPNVRVTSAEVSSFLREQLAKLEGGGIRGKEVRVELPPIIGVGDDDYGDGVF